MFPLKLHGDSPGGPALKNPPANAGDVNGRFGFCFYLAASDLNCGTRTLEHGLSTWGTRA